MKNNNKRPPGLSDGIRLCLGLILAFMTFPAFAFNTYLTEFNSNYGTQGTRLDSCGLCHVDFNGGGTRTIYGEDYLNNNYSSASIGLFDSDGDGFTNDQEAAVATLTLPSFSCNDLPIAVNAPVNIADYADPSNPGCIGSGQPPVANANGPYSVVTGDFITLSSAGSFDPDGAIVAYFWDFGSFGTSVDPNPQVSFTLPFNAVVVIKLSVTDNDGNITTTTAKVNVLQSSNFPPTADAGPAVTGSANSLVQFNGTGSSDPEGASLNYAWNFDDTTSGAGSVTTHSYARCGTYNVTLTVTDDLGLQGTAATTATISGSGVNPPTANAGGGPTAIYDGTLGSNVQFDGSASADSDCDIVNYSWDFGDGITGLGVNPLHSYALAGSYVVTLTVTDTDGLMTSAFASVNIVDTGPLDGLTLYDTNCGACHGFGDTSTKAGATVTRINNGIVNAPSMNSLSSLSVAEIQAIADYLATIVPPPPPPPPPGPIDGAVSYDTNCGACHGFGDTSTKAGATVTRINNGIVSEPSMGSLSSLSVDEIQAIADYLATIVPPPPPPPPPGPIDGMASYDTNCGACHGFGDTSTKAGATVSRINDGIVNVPSMNSLSSLSVDEIQAIADYLATIVPTPPPPPPPGPIDGMASYDANCGACHGFGTSSTKAGATVTRINDGIVNVPSMNSLSNLSVDEVQAIADFLMSLAPPSTPQGLYAAHCGSCHGADGSGGTSGENVIGDSADSISSAIEKEEEMQSLSFLSDNEIQLISDFLNGDTSLPPPPGPVDGAASYDANCGSCHGFGTNTTKAGATVTRINDGIVNVSSMNSLSSLSAVEIQSIADFLATIAPPSTPQGLYATYCGACHGADGSGGTSGEKVIGDSASKISSAIEKEEEMQSLSFLSDNEIQLISDFLNGDTSTPPPPGPVDGAASYDANCGACHGFGTNSTKAGATVTRINNGITGEPSMASLSNLSAAEIQAIADFLASIVAPPPPPPGPIDGAASYDANCGSCHGFGTTSTKAGATVTRINDGIVAVPSMNSLSSLSAAEIQAIADFLASIVAPPPPPGPVDGAASYDANCGSCHGFGTSSTKAGATVTRINDGIVAVPSMNSLSSLSATEIQAIADFLMSLAPPSTPEGLYAAHCGSCHGADGSGGTSGVNVIGDSASKISNEIAAVQEMQSLSFLTDSEIQLISDFLNGITTPPPGSIDGLALYDINCAGCHGPSSNSEKVGATAARINSGIINEPSMFFFSTALTAAEVQAIADFLVSVAPPPPVGSDGAALYTINCAGCHGPGDNSAKAGATVARINSGISSASSMNFLSSVLTAADIQAIADFLATTPPPGTPEAKYLTYCSSCHGADGRSGSGGNVTGDSAEDIEDAIDKEEEMQSLSFLSSSDISDIADYLDVLKQQEAQLEHSWYSSRWH